MRRPVVAGLLVALLTACSGPAETPTAPAPAAAASAAPAGPTGLELEARRHATAQRILHRRAAAVRAGDERAFLADLVPGDPALRARQRRLFANLVSLPLQTFTLDAAQATWPAGFAAPRYRRSAYIPYVEQRLRLRGLDDAPATTVYGLTLAPVRGRWRIVSDDDTAGRESDGARDAPWDLTRIVVRRTPHALGIFDTGSAPAADRLMAWTEDSIRTVRQRVPLRWPGTVTVYALSSPRLLARMGTRYLDRAAIAFPVLDDNTRPTRRVSTRVLINPRHLPQTEHEAGYLLSHEITHVALARTDAGTPAWVQEGLADYVATRGASPSWWQPSPASVARALDGAAAMPGSTFFGDADPGFEYDLSLAACAYLADRFGERRLWVFLRRLAAAGRASGDSEEPVDPMLRTMFGIDTSRLAGEAARLVVRRGGAT